MWPPAGSPACPGTTPNGSPPASPLPSTSPWSACSPSGGRDLGRSRRAARDLAGARRAARPDRGPPTRPPPTAGTAWPAAGSCWSTTWPPPAAPAGAAATLRHAGARHVEAAVLATAPTAVSRRPGGLWSRVAPGSQVAPDPRAPPRPTPSGSTGAAWASWPGCREVVVWPGSALLTPVALCGCDPFSCVESGQYDQRAVKEDGPHAEVMCRRSLASCSGCKG